MDKKGLTQAEHLPNIHTVPYGSPNAVDVTVSSVPIKAAMTEVCSSSDGFDSNR